MENHKLSLKLKDLLRKVIIVDSSVLIKEILEENGSDFVDKLVQLNLKYELTLMSTPLLVFEFFNIISRALKNESEAKVIFQQFKKMKIGIIDLDDEAIYSAISYVSKNSSLSFYDAAYHALAKSMDYVFLTADEKYYNLMRREKNIMLLK